MIKKFVFVFFLLFISIIFIKEAHVTETYYEDYTLEKLIERSQNIALAEKKEPFITYQKKTIHWNIIKYKPYQQEILNFKVIEDIYSESGELLAGKEINVLPAKSEWKFDLYKGYEIEGIKKSPIFKRYPTKTDFYKTKYIILFLNAVNNNYEFTAEDAYESIDKKKIIMQILNKSNKTNE